MIEIYINTTAHLEPDDITAGDIYPEGGDESKSIAIKVIRAATIEEYVAWVNQNNLGHMINRSIFEMKFYLVEVLD